MLAFIKTRWVLFLILGVFIICKLPHLHYAFYWDECYPYAPAIKAMCHHGVSLMPNAMDTELSKGHPLFFHAAAAAWMNIFGTSHTAAHAFALFISVLLLIAVYEVGHRLFNARVALLGTLLIATQVVFFVQSSFVLPEVLIALLAFLAIYFYVCQRFLLTAVFLAVLFYTKESGLVPGIVLGADAFIRLFNNKELLKSRLLRCFSVAVPFTLIAFFFIVQKHQNGWYLNPDHTKYIKLEWNEFWYSFRMNCISSLVLNDDRNFYFFLLLLLSIAAAIKNRSFKYLVIFFPVIICYYFVDDMRAGRPLPSIPFFMLFMVSVAWMLYVLHRLKVWREGRQQHFIVLSMIFIFCFLCFSAANFFTPRYLLMVLVPFLFFTAVVFDEFIKRTNTILFYPVLLITLGIGVYSYCTNRDFGDNDPGAFQGLAAQQSVVDFLEQNNAYDKVIGSRSFIGNVHLTNAATGFLSSEKVFKHVSVDINGFTNYAVFDDLAPDSHYEAIKKDSMFHLVFRQEDGKVWTEIYERRR